ncbi:hypothetical protein [Herbiconiux sp. YIM B11900]|uniref:hypothetical protein n=1 Tax=Herbiconiux sp. YIM B11900 TaxID=3404131 RepID=UPI003F852318
MNLVTLVALYAAFVIAAAFLVSANALFGSASHPPHRARRVMIVLATTISSIVGGLIPPVAMRAIDDAALASLACLGFLIVSVLVFSLSRRSKASGSATLPSAIGAGAIALGSVTGGCVEWVIRGPGPSPLANAFALAFLLVLLVSALILVVRKVIY